MAETATEKAASYIKETGMLTGTTGVIAGVSGGADSVFLFHVLREVCREANLPFEVIHVHHGIRAVEADRDAAFVTSLCRKWEVPCSLVKRAIPKEARAARETLEEAGRNARYEIFSRAANAKPGSCVALAHHKNDAAETLLFNLARGTGLLGLAGLRPVRGIYIRPLLSLTRDEIEAELFRRHLTWCEDSTNADDDAARNRIRHHVLPYLTQEINAQSVTHFAETARIAGDAADFIRAEAARRADRYCQTEEGMRLISYKMKLEEPRIMQEEIVRLEVEALMTSLKDISGLHIRLILELFERETGKFLNLPKGLTAEKRRGAVALSRQSKAKKSTRKHGRVIQ